VDGLTVLAGVAGLALLLAMWMLLRPARPIPSALAGLMARFDLDAIHTMSNNDLDEAWTVGRRVLNDQRAAWHVVEFMRTVDKERYRRETNIRAVLTTVDQEREETLILHDRLGPELPQGQRVRDAIRRRN
jgi:hypothetical protein